MFSTGLHLTHVQATHIHMCTHTHTRHNFQGSIVLENEQTQLIFKMIDRNYLVALLVTKVVFVFFVFLRTFSIPFVVIGREELVQFDVFEV